MLLDSIAHPKKIIRLLLYNLTLASLVLKGFELDLYSVGFMLLRSRSGTNERWLSRNCGSLSRFGSSRTDSKYESIGDPMKVDQDFVKTLQTENEIMFKVHYRNTDLQNL